MEIVQVKPKNKTRLEELKAENEDLIAKGNDATQKLSQLQQFIQDIQMLLATNKGRIEEVKRYAAESEGETK